MANKKISELTALVTPAATDVLAIVDVAGAETKKITVANLTAGAGGGIVLSVKVSLSSADVNNMKYSNTPITLKAAEAAKIIVPVSCICVATAGVAETSSDDLRIGWSAADSTTSQYWGSTRDFMNGVSSGTITQSFGGPTGGNTTNNTTFSITNKPFQIWCSDNFLGTWSMDVYFSYYLADA